MFEFKTIVTQPIYKLNYKIPCLITAPMRSDLKETTTQKNNKKISKNKTSRQKVNI